MNILKFVNEKFDVLAEIELDDIEFNGHTDEFVELAELLLAGHYGANPEFLMKLLSKLQNEDYYVFNTEMKQYYHQPKVVLIDNLDDVDKLYDDTKEYDEQLDPPILGYSFNAPMNNDESPSLTVKTDVKEVKPTVTYFNVRPAGDAEPTNTEVPSDANLLSSADAASSSDANLLTSTDAVAATPADSTPTKRRRKKSSRKTDISALELELKTYLDKVKELEKTLNALRAQQSSKRKDLLQILDELLAENGFTAEELDHAAALAKLLRSST